MFKNGDFVKDICDGALAIVINDDFTDNVSSANVNVGVVTILTEDGRMYTRSDDCLESASRVAHPFVYRRLRKTVS